MLYAAKSKAAWTTPLTIKWIYLYIASLGKFIKNKKLEHDQFLANLITSNGASNQTVWLLTANSCYNSRLPLPQSVFVHNSKHK